MYCFFSTGNNFYDMQKYFPIFANQENCALGAQPDRKRIVKNIEKACAQLIEERSAGCLVSFREPFFEPL